MLLSAVLSTCFAAIAWAAPEIRHLGNLENETFFENIAIRPNGNLLVTQLLRESNVYTIKKPESRQTSLEVVATLPFGNASVGITQISDIDGLETYVVTGADFLDGQNPISGTYTAYTLQFKKKTDEVQLKKITALGPVGVAANGIISSDDYPGVVFIADSFTGYIGRLDVYSGVFEQGVWSYEELSAPPGMRLGINGIKVFKGFLYWTNSMRRAVYKVPITKTGRPVPQAQVRLVADLSHVSTIIDDFTIDSRGNIWTATNLDNTVIFSDGKTGESKIVAGGLQDLVLLGVGAVAIGRETKNEIVLYGVTSGGLERPVNGITEGAKVSSIKFKTKNGKPY
jgi:hypothetical protein